MNPIEIQNSKIKKPFATFGYVRVSTDRQELSVEAQVASIQRAAKYQDLGPVDIFTEPDTSGSVEFAQRPDAQRLVQAIKDALPRAASTVLIIPKVDRIGRDTIDVSVTARFFEQLGVRLIFLDINVDTRTPMGRAFMQIAAVFAELELARIRERIRDAIAQKRSKNELTGTVPYGWDAIETGQVTPKAVKIRELVPNPAEQQWILHMLQLRKLGFGYHSIARDLNSRGVPTKHGQGDIMKLRSAGDTPADKRFTTGRWQSGFVAKVLNSKTVRDWLASRQQQAA